MKFICLILIMMSGSLTFAANEIEVFKCDQFLKNSPAISIVTTAPEQRGWDNYYVKIATSPRPTYEKLTRTQSLPNGTALVSKSFEIFVTFVPDHGNQSMAYISLKGSNLKGSCY
jgi:hypothetical protein